MNVEKHLEKHKEDVAVILKLPMARLAGVELCKDCNALDPGMQLSDWTSCGIEHDSDALAEAAEKLGFKPKDGLEAWQDEDIIEAIDNDYRQYLSESACRNCGAWGLAGEVFLDLLEETNTPLHTPATLN